MILRWQESMRWERRFPTECFLSGGFRILGMDTDIRFLIFMPHLRIMLLVSSLFYVYAPYHAVDIYVRGDVAEFWAYAFIPLAFYGMLKAFQEKKWKYIVVGAFGFSGVILSHNLTAM